MMREHHDVCLKRDMTCLTCIGRQTRRRGRPGPAVDATWPRDGPARGQSCREVAGWDGLDGTVDSRQQHGWESQSMSKSLAVKRERVDKESWGREEQCSMYMRACVFVCAEERRRWRRQEVAASRWVDTSTAFLGKKREKKGGSSRRERVRKMQRLGGCQSARDGGRHRDG